MECPLSYTYTTEGTYGPEYYKFEWNTAPNIPATHIAKYKVNLNDSTKSLIGYHNCQEFNGKYCDNSQVLEVKSDNGFNALQSGNPIRMFDITKPLNMDIPDNKYNSLQCVSNNRIVQIIGENASSITYTPYIPNPLGGK